MRPAPPRELAARPGWESRGRGAAGCDPARAERPGRGRRLLAAGAERPARSSVPRACPIRSCRAPSSPGPSLRAGRPAEAADQLRLVLANSPDAEAVLAPEPRRTPAQGLGGGPGRRSSGAARSGRTIRCGRAGALRRRVAVRRLPPRRVPGAAGVAPCADVPPGLRGRRVALPAAPVPDPADPSVVHASPATPRAGSASGPGPAAACSRPSSSTPSARATAG